MGFQCRVHVALFLGIGSLLVASTGCEPTQHLGDEYKCIDTATVLSGLDAPLPSGQGTAREYLSKVLGNHAFEFSVPEQQKPVTTYTPDSRGVKGSLDVSLVPGSIRFITSKAPAIPKGLMLDVHCPNRIEAETQAHFHSQDGAFNEQFNAKIAQELPFPNQESGAHPREPMSLSTELPTSGRQGSFQLQQPADFPPEKTEAHRLVFGVSWDKDMGMKGQLSASWTSKPEVGPGNEKSQGMATMEIYNLHFEGSPSGESN